MHASFIDHWPLSIHDRTLFLISCLFLCSFNMPWLDLSCLDLKQPTWLEVTFPSYLYVNPSIPLLFPSFLLFSFFPSFLLSSFLPFLPSFLHSPPINFCFSFFFGQGCLCSRTPHFFQLVCDFQFSIFFFPRRRVVSVFFRIGFEFEFAGGEAGGEVGGEVGEEVGGEKNKKKGWGGGGVVI